MHIIQPDSSMHYFKKSCNNVVNKLFLKCLCEDSFKFAAKCTHASTSHHLDYQHVKKAKYCLLTELHLPNKILKT